MLNANFNEFNAIGKWIVAHTQNYLQEHIWLIQLLRFTCKHSSSIRKIASKVVEYYVSVRF